MGDPWYDLGLIGFYRDVKSFSRRMSSDPFYRIELTPASIEWEWSDEQEGLLREFILDRTKRRLNSVWTMPLEMRFLNMSWFQDAFCKNTGYINPNYTWNLTTEQLHMLKTGEGLDESNIIKKPRKELKPNIMRNFTGTKKDWEFSTTKIEEDLDCFFIQLSGAPVNKGSTCPFCGAFGVKRHFRSMNQSKNVLFNQHHSTPVRGYQSQVAKSEMCPICNWINLYSSLMIAERPYFVGKDQVTHLLIPEANDLDTLHQLVGKFGRELKDFSSRLFRDYQTNIQNLWQKTTYVSLIYLYYFLQRVDEQEDAEMNPYMPDSTQWKYSLHHWTIARFTGGKNIQFRELYRIPVNEKQVLLTQDIVYGKEGQAGNIVVSFFQNIKCENKRTLDQLAKGIFENDLSVISKNLFLFYKEAGKKPESNRVNNQSISFFKTFILYLNSLQEENQMISDDLSTRLRSLGYAIGSNCYEDMNLLTKLNTAASPEHLRQTLAEVTFKMVKLAQKNQNKSELADVRPMRVEDVDQVMKEVSIHNFRGIKETLAIFVNLYAFHALNHKNSKKEKE